MNWTALWCSIIFYICSYSMTMTWGTSTEAFGSQEMISIKISPQSAISVTSGHMQQDVLKMSARIIWKWIRSPMTTKTFELELKLTSSFFQSSSWSSQRCSSLCQLCKAKSQGTSWILCHSASRQKTNLHAHTHGQFRSALNPNQACLWPVGQNWSTCQQSTEALTQY